MNHKGDRARCIERRRNEAEVTEVERKDTSINQQLI